MITKKMRRHSGRYSPRRAGKVKISEMIDEALEPNEEYDDWRDYRDGMRYNSDRTHLRNKNVKGWKEDIEKINRKLKKILLIRKARKKGRLL